MSKILKFPEDFIKRNHPVFNHTYQYLDKVENTTISIVGGANGLYGNGITTFEMMDNRSGDVQGYLTVEEINNYLQNNPLQD